MAEKCGFVYIWRDKKHKRYYIGSHWGFEDDSYICSSTWMRNAHRIRPKDFKRRILEIVPERTNLAKREQYWLDMIKDHELRVRYYNLQKNAYYTWSPENELTTREKISKRTKEAMQRPEVRAKYEEGLKKRNTRWDDPVIRQKHLDAWEKVYDIRYPDRHEPKPPPMSKEEQYKIVGAVTKKRWEDPEYRKRMSQVSIDGNIGKLWWTDGQTNIRSKDCPGDKYRRGMTKNRKAA